MTQETLYRILPLVWKTRHGFFRATTALGCIYIVAMADGKINWRREDNDSRWYEASTIQKAKAAAEAHYRERLLACLEVVPMMLIPVGDEAMVPIRGPAMVCVVQMCLEPVKKDGE